MARAAPPDGQLRVSPANTSETIMPPVNMGSAPAETVPIPGAILPVPPVPLTPGAPVRPAPIDPLSPPDGSAKNSKSSKSKASATSDSKTGKPAEVVVPVATPATKSSDTSKPIDDQVKKAGATKPVVIHEGEWSQIATATTKAKTGSGPLPPVIVEAPIERDKTVEVQSKPAKRKWFSNLRSGSNKKAK